MTLKPRVLIAEDSADLRDLYGFVQKQAGFDVAEAVDGEEAWQALQHNPPDVFVTDIMMPKLAGVELVKRIRSEAEFGVARDRRLSLRRLPGEGLRGRGRAGDPQAVRAGEPAECGARSVT